MKKAVRITLAYVLTCVFVLTGVLALAAPMRAIAEETSAQGPAATTTVDPDTRDRWKHWAAGGGDESRLSTQNVGRIWTDKTVEAAGDEDQSNFLTTLSVMSSTSNTTVTQSMPLDIVLVLDVSGSMDDPMGSTDSTKRIDALKTAAGSFIDTIAKQNEGLSAEKQHQVAIVKFAGDENNWVGNGKYRDGGYTYNYTQVMKRLSVCNSGSSSSFKDTVNKIDPSGPTRADNGMKLAQLELKTYGRANAKKIVVFFTDGKPTSRSDFDPTVASNAVSTAKAMKDSGTTIYTIGIFAGANPKADPTKNGTSDENKFMHAASSNYPAATSYTSDKLGARAQDSVYYQSAATSSELKKVFEGISQSITTGAGYPTHIEEGFEASESGYITFTDTLGDFIQVDGFRSAQISGATFPTAAKTSHGNVDTYEFSGAAHDLVITVERAGEDNPRQGDKVTVRVPASLIPLREYKVDEAKGTFEVADIGSVMPLRVTYASSVKAAARDHLFEPGDTPGLSDYIDENWDREADTLSFLANKWSGKWSGGELGDTIASFQPSSTNRYYYFQKATPLYTDEACTRRATKAPQGGETYYYKDEYVAQGKDGKPQDAYTVIAVDGGAIASFEGALTIEGGGYAFAKGTARLAFINQLYTEKTAVGDNATGTARDVLNPRWNDDASVSNATHIESHLGNNGRITLSLATTPAELDTKAGFGLSKVLDGRDWTDSDKFTFRIDLTSGDREGQSAKGDSAVVTVTKADLDESGRAAIDFGKITFTKVGTYEYEVYEEEPEGTADHVKDGVTYSTDRIKVTVVVTVDKDGKFSAAVTKPEKTTFTNTYDVTPSESSVTDQIKVSKALTGRDMAEGEFSFELVEGEGGAAKVVAEGTNGEDGNVVLSKVTYKAAGTHIYTLHEVNGGNTEKGMTYDPATYTVTTTVADNGDGTLSVQHTLDGPTTDNPSVTFNNTYETSPVEAERFLRGTKTLTGRDALEGEKFSFEAKQVSGPEGGVSGFSASAEVAGAKDGGRVAFDFGNATFSLPGEYVFEIREVPPAEPAGGMTYDGHTCTATIKVKDQDGALVVESTTYSDEAIDGVEGASFFNAYRPADAEYAGINVTKVLNGREMAAGEFAFEIEGDDEDSEALLSDADRSFVNGGPLESGQKDEMRKLAGLTFTKENVGKTYSFTVSETAPADDQKLPGVTYDAGAHSVQIKVDDALNGAITATTTVDGEASDEVAFVNSYEAGPGELATATFGLGKKLNGRDWADGDSFTFELAAVTEGAPMPERTTATVTAADVADGRAAFDFGTITYNATGSYEYEVREQNAGQVVNGMTYSANVARVRVSVVDDAATGKLVATPSLISGSATFENGYSVELDYDAKGGLSIAKTLVGASAEAGKFSFTVTPEGDDVLGIAGTYASPVLTDGVAATIAATSGQIVFTQRDAGKSWGYTVTESDPGGGFTCDGATWNIRVSVADDPAAGRLSVTTVATGGGAEQSWTYTSDAGRVEGAPNVINFVNRYSACGATTAISGTKTLTGRQMADGEFSFELAYAADPANVVARAGNAGGTVDFGSLSYTTDSLRQLVADGLASRTGTGWSVGYVAREATAGLADAGITAQASTFGVTVNVTDNGDGTLTCDVAYPDGGLAFVNEYQPTEATISLTGMKSLNVPEGLTGPADITGKFTFTATGEEGAPMPERTSATNDVSGTVDFGGITFTLENTFGGAQTQAEDVADEEAAKKDAAAPLDTPVVADDGAAGKKGAADEASEIMGEDSEAEGATDLAPVPDADAQELNAEPDTEVDSVPETEPDPAPLAEEEPAPLADTPVVQEAPAEELAPVAAVARWTPKRSAIRLAVNDGKVDGAQVVADNPALETDPQADAGIAAAPAAQAPGPRSRIFRYVVTESGSLPGVANDARASRDVYIKVTDDGAGHLSAEFVDGPDVASARHLDAPDLAFINTYDVTGTSASITARKSLDGRDLVAGEFEFALMGAGGQTVLTATNDADGNVSFEAIEYTAPGTYTYTIRELVPVEPRGGVKYDGRSVQVSVTVTDDGEGHLVAKAEYAADAVFENTYTAAPADVMISAKKVLRGAALARGRFTFLLTGEVDGKAVELTATNDADGNVAFPHLVFENAGTYTFKVSEVDGKEDRVTYDKHAYTVTVEVEDNGEGQLVATVMNDAKGGALVFMNTYTPPTPPTTPTNPPTTTPKTPPSTPTGTTTTTGVRNTAGRTPKTGDDLLAATTLTLLATVGGVIVAIAVRLARRRREF